MAASMRLIQICLLAASAESFEGRFSMSLHGNFWAQDEMAPAKLDANNPTDSTAPKQDTERPTEKGHDRVGGKFERSLKKRHREETEENPKGNEIETIANSKYPFITATHMKLAAIFGKTQKSWWMDWKLWVGLTVWLAAWAQWLGYGYSAPVATLDAVYWQRSLAVFGFDIVILHILQYAPSIKIGMGVVCSILCAQSLFQSYLFFKFEDPPPAGDGDAPPAEEFNADTLYLDLMLPFEQIFILFVAQIGVWWFYMTSILGNFDLANVNYLFWLWAFMAIQITMIFNRGDDSALGNDFPIAEVYRLVLKTDQVSFALEDADDKASQFTLSKASIIARGCMGYFCNGILREIMAYTIPLMLMGFSEPMDFVVYCVGVNFICTLDDMSDRKYLMTDRTTSEEKVCDA